MSYELPAVRLNWLRDYAMRNGVLKLKVRKAMEGYLRDRLGLTMTDGRPPPRLLE